MSTLNAGETLQPFKPLRNNLIFDSSGNLVGIQNDRANGNDFRIGGGSGVDGTFATLVATTALKINSGGTFDLYNTADQTTNYEVLRANWAANQAQIFVRQAGTGVQRALAIGISTGTAGTAPAVGMLVSGSTPYVGIGWLGAASSLSGPFAGIALGSYNASSGTQTITSASPTINQSGTASYTVLDVNPTESATGSGSKLLQRWAVGGVAVATITNAGFLSANNLYASGSFNLSGSFGSAQDVTLTRDAADTLALRRDANAQTFRVYNTYTDASNGEYLQAAWSGNVAYIRTVAQGTGVSRSLVIGTFGATSVYFQTNTVTKWEVSSSGHFLTIADNTYDIGASGANRPRNLYLGGAVNVPAGNGGVAIGVTASSSTMLAIAASATSRSHLNLTGGVAPTAPNNGDIWFDGTNLFMRIGGVTKTFTIV